MVVKNKRKNKASRTFIFSIRFDNNSYFYNNLYYKEEFKYFEGSPKTLLNVWSYLKWILVSKTIIENILPLCLEKNIFKR